MPPTPYCAEKAELLVCTSWISSWTVISEFALAGRVVSAPSASTVLKGKLPFTDNMVPLEVPEPTTPWFPIGAPAAPACRILKLDQSCPIELTCGSCDRVSELRVVVIAPFSVFSRATSVLTTTCVLTVPTANWALTVVGPTGTVIEDRTSVLKPCLVNVSL